MKKTTTQKMKLKIGDPVYWTSSGRGSFSKKKGVIAARVKAGTKPKLPRGVKKARSMFTGGPRKGDSFLVIVENKGLKGKELLPQLYWPRPELLKTRAVRK